MADHKEQINTIMTIATSIWLVFLCLLIVLSILIFPIIICTATAFCCLSLVVAVFNFIRIKAKHLALKILCLVLAFPFPAGVFNPFSVIVNPFTSQKFAEYPNTYFFGRGTITYYRKSGFFYTHRRNQNIARF